MNFWLAGVFAMLDEECRIPGGSDRGFYDKIVQAHGKNAYFKKTPKTTNQFTIMHFAGDVSYTADGAS